MNAIARLIQYFRGPQQPKPQPPAPPAPAPKPQVVYEVEPWTPPRKLPPRRQQDDPISHGTISWRTPLTSYFDQRDVTGSISDREYDEAYLRQTGHRLFPEHALSVNAPYDSPAEVARQVAFAAECQRRHPTISLGVQIQPIDSDAEAYRYRRELNRIAEFNREPVVLKKRQF
jgi:hypothetical protein